MSEPVVVYRHLAPADRELRPGARFSVTEPVAVTSDARQATRNWADEGVLAIWCDEDTATIPAGAVLTAAGKDVVLHHGASALDLELPLLVCVAEGTQMGADATMRAALLLRLALASGEATPDGRDYATPLPRTEA